MFVNVCVKNKSNAFRAFSLFCKKKAVLTIETAIVLPIFTIAILTLLSVMSVFYVNCKIDGAIAQEAEYAAMKSHDDMAYGIGGIRANVISKLGDRLLGSGLIEGGESGLDFSSSDLSDREIIILNVNYRIRLPFTLIYSYSIPYNRRAVIHTWTGYVNGLNGIYDADEYVYMTNNGSVYHRSRECSHIKLTIKKVNGKDIKKLRNEDGSKYKKCEYCKPKLSDERLYVTTDGDRYHNTLNCSGIKRTVRRVKLSEISGVMPCSRCGY